MSLIDTTYRPANVGKMHFFADYVSFVTLRIQAIKASSVVAKEYDES